MGKRSGCVILSGGRGRRMGFVDKGELTYRGRSFRALIGSQLEELGLPCFLSAAEYELQAGMAEEENGSVWQVIQDDITDVNGQYIGPMGGIFSCLTKTGLDGILVVSCDMPFFRREMADALLREAEDGRYDAVIWKTRDGRLHPVCAYYSNTCLPAFREAIEEKDYRMMHFLSHTVYKELETADTHIPDSWFTNVNRPEVYTRLESGRIPVLAVSGRKNTGKTTLLERLVRELTKRGVRTAVIKHDGHDFVPDTPGTDSFRMKQAGAVGTVVYSGNRFSLVKDRMPEEKMWEAEDFIACFPDADLILLEGQKASSYPKIEVLRRETAMEPVCRRDTVLAYVADWELEQGTEEGLPPVYSFEDMDEILEVVILCMDRGKL